MSNYNTSDSTKALTAMLRDDPVVSDLASVISRAGVINRNPDKTPWMGVYKGPTQYQPRTLGPNTQNWNVSVSLRVVLQVHSHDSEKAEEQLEELIEHVVRVTFADPTLDGTVMHVLGYTVDYGFIEDEDATAFFQMANVTITAETQTG